MNYTRSTIYWILMLIVAATSASYLFIRTRANKPTVCTICERQIHKGSGYILRLKGGGIKSACCPRCGLRYQAQNFGNIQRIEATDFSTGQRVDGTKAAYVEGSDVHECCQTAALRDITGTRYELEWDRCLPSLIAFKSEADAKAFRSAHGGKIKTYNRILDEFEGKK